MTNNNKLMRINSIKALFIIESKIENCQKVKFLKRIEEDLLDIVESHYLNETYLNNEINRILKSKAYRFGKIILKPFLFLKINRLLCQKSHS